ncbi:MAG: hypothetical protein ACFE8L_05905 [Candidatus Hodarchaeota archaeon]
MALEALDIVNGIFSLIFVAISLLVGLIILSKYFQYKEKIYLFVGCTWILISEPWWPSSLSFLIAIVNDVGISSQWYFLIGNIFVPVAIILWLIAFTEFLYKEKRKLILVAFGMYGILFEIIFFILLFLNPELIGELNPPVDVNYKFFIMVSLISFLLIVVISGFFFANLSLKSDDPEVKLKGRLLFLAYISFAIGALLDSAIPLNEITIIITRIILISSAIEWYGGFILPGFLRKILLKKK